MSKHTIIHPCGHCHDYHLLDRRRDRDRKLSWLAEQDCPRCRAKAHGPTAYVRYVQDGTQAVMDVAVVNCYEHRESLRRRHYAYVDDIVTGDGGDLIKAMMAPGRKGWRAHFRGAIAEVRAALKIEVDWLRSQGWSIRMVDPISSMVLGALGEGRREMLP